MTIIEFYDKAAIENIAGALLCAPQKVILIGHDNKKMYESREIYRSILKKHGLTVEIEPKGINRNNLESIVKVLSDIVEKNEDCVFDLTGGEDLYLVAVGIIMKTYGSRVQCHRFNFNNDTVIDCDKDGNVCKTGSFDISIEDNIKMYGGRIVTDPRAEMYTYPWDMNAEFLRDIDLMWDICRADAGKWNTHMTTLGSVYEKMRSKTHPLTLSFNQSAAIYMLKQDGEKYIFYPELMHELQSKGLISSFSYGDDVSCTFKNEQVMKCLTVAGQVLELKAAELLRSIKDEKGDPLYHDIKVGVVIDWDGDNMKDRHRTINEIDIIAMKSAIPIFISCKNGRFDAGELFKLHTVAERFGNKYVKKVIIASEIDKLKLKGKQLHNRAIDMGIRTIENVDEMSENGFREELRTLWN